MPYMREFFQEKFQVPVEFFNPLRNVTVSSSLNVEEIGHKAHTLGGLVGLALRSVSSCPMELNLRPAVVIRRQQTARQRPALVLAVLALLATLAAWWLYYGHTAKLTTQVTEERVSPRVNELKTIEGRMNAVASETKQQQEAAGPLLQAIKERAYWTTVLNDINSRLPKDNVWITSFEPEIPGGDNPPTPAPGGRGAPAAQKKAAPIVLIRGLYMYNDRQTAVVDEFMENLKKSELYTIGDKPEKIINVPNEAEWAYEFSFPLVLKNPIVFTPPDKGQRK
jgi:Tfp pilus assembly protein PilN